MKRFTFLLFVCFCIGSLMAQEIDVFPVQIPSQKCGADSTLTPLTFVGATDTPSYVCRLKADFPEKEDALNDIFSGTIGQFRCNAKSCRPQPAKCHPLYEVLDGQLKVRHTAEKWCFRGRAQLKWTCSECGVKVTNPNNDHKYSFSEIENSSTNLSEASFQKIFPNPSSGLVNLEVKTAENHGEVVIKVFDLTGELVNQEIYQADPDSKFLAQIDLSELAHGIYLVSTFVDEQLIGTSRVMIQQ